MSQSQILEFEAESLTYPGIFRLGRRLTTIAEEISDFRVPLATMSIAALLTKKVI